MIYPFTVSSYFFHVYYIYFQWVNRCIFWILFFSFNCLCGNETNANQYNSIQCQIHLFTSPNVQNWEHNMLIASSKRNNRSMLNNELFQKKLDYELILWFIILQIWIPKKFHLNCTLSMVIFHFQHFKSQTASIITVISVNVSRITQIWSAHFSFQTQAENEHTIWLLWEFTEFIAQKIHTSKIMQEKDSTKHNVEYHWQ